jgi:hypothetical protein
MKNKFFIVALASAIAFALAFATSCEEKDENEEPVTPTLSVDKTTIPATQPAGTYAIAVTSNVAWTASASANFVTLDPTGGTGNATVKVTLTANTGESARTATITVNAEGVDSKMVTVTQAGLSPAQATLSVSPTTFTFPVSGGDEAALLTANADWASTVTYEPVGENWLTVSPATGTATSNDGAVLSIAATANTGNERSATVTFSATGADLQTITVTQGGTMVEVAESDRTITVNADGDIDYPAEGNAEYAGDTIIVNANIDWTVVVTTSPDDNPELAPAHTESHEWVSATRSGNFLIYKIDANPYPRARAATITVTSSKEPIPISVTQSAREYMFVGGAVVGVWDGPTIPELTETSSGVYEIERNFSAGIFKLPLKNRYPTAFFAAGTTDEVITPGSAGNDLYLVPLTINWSSTSIDLKWKIETAGYYKLTVDLNTMKVKLETAIPALGPGEVLIAGKIWSKYNVGEPGQFVSTPDEVGKYYQWLGMTGYSDTDPWLGANGAHMPINDIMWNTSTEYPNPCPEGWTVPNDSELNNLAKTGFTFYAANAVGYTIAGVFLGPNHATATATDPQGCIFIPAGGHRAPADGVLTSYGEKSIVHSANPMWGVSSQIFSFPKGYHDLAYHGSVDGTEGYYWYEIATESNLGFNWGAGANVRCVKR